MSQNIKNNYIKHIDSKLFYKNYFDYMLYCGEVFTQPWFDIQNMLIADFSTLHIYSGILYSTVVWSGATNGGVEMHDIGMTGVDNGLIVFDKGHITNAEFLEIYFNSVYNIESGDTRLFLTPVTGNTQMYSYPMRIIETDSEKYIELTGGFYQGFFKLYGFDYQVLPDMVGDDIVMHFEIRPRSDYSIPGNAVNNLHPENSGIFFFMGTRAENKFWPYYKYDSATTETMIRPSQDGSKYDDTCIVKESSWLKDEYMDYVIGSTIERKTTQHSTVAGSGSYFIVDEDLSQDKYDGYLNMYNFNPYNNCDCNKQHPQPDPEPDDKSCDDSCDDYFKDSYVEDTSSCQFYNGKSINDEYIFEDVTIDVDSLTDSEGRPLTERGYYEITESDNKFLMFDRTDEGFTVSNWIEGTTVVLTGRTDWPNANYFLLMNRTDTGYTVDTIQNYDEENSYDYNIFKDIRNNVFALRITENGAIGYRYGVLNCDDEFPNHYELIEEYSKDGIIKPDEWNNINVRFVPIPHRTDKCDTRAKKMRILIYVNGFLKLISKQLDSFNFKELDDLVEKQEAVPYNISLGGGSLGLLETILPNYYKINEYILPIEKDFCGTFIGDIKSFQIYQGFINYSSIANYLS